MKTPYPILSIRFWHAYFIHLRPYLLFVSGVAGLSGMAVADNFDLWRWDSLILFLAFFFGYGFGQALTDGFQTDTDRLSAPHRPLSQGGLTPRAVGMVSLLGLVMIAVVIIAANSYNALFCGLSIFGLATYSYVKKHYWLGGPFYNAWIVMLLPFMGYLSFTGAKPAALLQLNLLPLWLLTFFSYSNFVLIGYLKDTGADRQTGYRTFPVVFGWDATVHFGDFLVLVSMAAGAFVALQTLAGDIFFTAACLLALAGQWYAHYSVVKTEADAYFPIAVTVRSFILWHLAVLLSCAPQLMWFALLYYFAFELTLRQKPERGQS